MDQTVEDLETMNDRFKDEIDKLVRNLSEKYGCLQYVKDLKNAVTADTGLSQRIDGLINAINSANENAFSSLYGVNNIITEKIAEAKATNAEAENAYNEQISDLSNITFE